MFATCPILFEGKRKVKSPLGDWASIDPRFDGWDEQNSNDHGLERNLKTLEIIDTCMFLTLMLVNGFDNLLKL